MFIVGFITAALIFLAALPSFVSYLYGKSTLYTSKNTQPQSENNTRDQILITYAYIIPQITLSLVSVLIIGTRLTKSLVEQGHGDFLFFALVFPVLGFLIGYLYLKKVIKE